MLRNSSGRCGRNPEAKDSVRFPDVKSEQPMNLKMNLKWCENCQADEPHVKIEAGPCLRPTSRARHNRMATDVGAKNRNPGTSPRGVHLSGEEFMESIVGRSDAIRQIDQSISTLATSEETVCVYGERGTGKTLIARAIHGRDPRRAGRTLVVVHCGTLPADSREADKIFDLLEGASQVARRGTLVLKQAAALSAPLQTGLFRAIRQHASVDTGIRVIATMTTDLFPPMEQGQSRAGLFHRLAGSTITVPPLRKRKADIPWLVAHFIHCFNVRHCRDIRGITRQALRVLLKHDWPGNVRELKRCIDRACVRTDHGVINCTELGAQPKL